MQKFAVMLFSFLLTACAFAAPPSVVGQGNSPDTSHAYWDATNKYSGINISGRGLIATFTGTAHDGFVRPTNALPNSKVWFQATLTAAFTGNGTGNAGNAGVGIIDGSVTASGGAACFASTNGLTIFSTNGKYFFNNGASATFATWATNKVGFAVDVPNRNVWICNPDSITTCIGGGNPATNTTPTKTLTGSNSLYACADPEQAFGTGGIQNQVRLISNSADVSMATPPAGFTAGF